MNNLLWAEWSNVEENKEEVKKLLGAFEGMIDGLMTLEDSDWIFYNLNSSPNEKEYYNTTRERFESFIKLAEEFDQLRSVLVGGVLDWNEIKRSLG